MLHYDSVRQVHFEPTQLCQASCPMCDRNENGGEVNRYLKNVDMTLEQCQQIFTPEFVKQLDTIFMCGNHGDPILCADALEMFRYFRETNPKINLSMTTNGGARSAEFWEGLAELKVHVNFSVDGLEDTNHLYRQGVQWKKIEENMDTFCSAGGKANWTFLVFNYNEHQVEEARRFAELIGVDNFIVKKSGRYLTSKQEKKTEHQAVFRGRLAQLLQQPTNEKYQNKELQKSVDIKKIMKEEKIFPKCVQKREIYVSAEGFVFPCCWTHGQMYKWYLEPQAAQIWEHINKHNISALSTSVKEVIEGGFFDSIEASWDKENRLEVCGLKCNKVFDPYTAQWIT